MTEEKIQEVLRSPKTAEVVQRPGKLTNMLRQMRNQRIAQYEREKIAAELQIEQVKPLYEYVDEWLDKNENNGLIAYGENPHHSTGILETEEKLIRSIAMNYKVKAVFLEEDVAMQKEVFDYFKTGDMSLELESYLRYGFVRLDSNSGDGHDYKLNLVKTCKQLSIPVIFIDNNNSSNRDQEWADRMKYTIGEELDGVYFLFAGVSHVGRESIEYHTGRKTDTAVNLLRDEYDKNILSLKVIDRGTRTAKVGDETSVVEKRYNQDLDSLDIQGTAATTLKGSPYEGILDSGDNRVIASNSYDAIVSVSGRYIGP